MRVGSGVHTYETVDGWAKLPENWNLGWIGGIATDRSGRVYCFCRGTHPMVVFDREGEVVDHWGEDLLNHAHGVFLDHQEQLWLTDRYAQVVWVYDLAGKLQRRLGYPYFTSDQGGLFNHPTNTYLQPDGTIYVSDGYQAAHCHRFAADGTLQLTWGTPGTGPGEFDLPHGIWVLPEDRVLVADRENHRIQLFTPDGEYLDQWTGLRLPMDVFVDADAGVIFLAEGGSRITLLDLDGEVITQWGEPGDGPAQYQGPHDIWVDDQGAIYVAEVGRSNFLHKLVPVR
jgi:sugar lactone lactonase YvrE